MIIFVKTPARHTITFGHLEPSNTIAFIKLLIYDIENKVEGVTPLLPDNMLLVYRGVTPLPDDETLLGAKIPDRTTLLVIPKHKSERVGADASDSVLLPPSTTAEFVPPPNLRSLGVPFDAVSKHAAAAKLDDEARRRTGIRLPGKARVSKSQKAKMRLSVQQLKEFTNLRLALELRELGDTYALVTDTAEGGAAASSSRGGGEAAAANGGAAEAGGEVGGTETIVSANGGGYGSVRGDAAGSAKAGTRSSGGADGG